ncbi:MULTISPECIES: SDR family oxidoreductase [unclassified Brevibacterium]|uniref:SDR family oxidoreductase n=1 Tax=unclassified Brevibacterium TaxID=2614124 RepID=UPI0008A13478|nr:MULTISPECIES: SDR family oxidoreductase [unclassified Brevibacterium]OFL67584.1 NAD-dependent dehydratase [Brevibacterium sp. HMSC063G07]
MARITIIGGHGKIALLAAPLLVKAGHEVTSVFRNPDHEADVAKTGAAPKVADVEQLDTAQLAQLFDGQDAVIWSAGAGGGNPARTKAVDQDAAIRTMDAAQHAGAKRYVMVSYFNSSRDHGVDPEDGFWHYAEAKSIADEHLRGTDLDWTILGPSLLTLEPGSGTITVDGKGSEVSRENVAQVIAAVVEDANTIGRTINFDDGDTPIAEAIH